MIFFSLYGDYCLVVCGSKMVYEFAGWGSPIMCCVQAPAVDVVGIGLEDGRCILHNLKFDEKVMTLRQEWGAVTTLSFRTGVISYFVRYILNLHSLCNAGIYSKRVTKIGLYVLILFWFIQSDEHPILATSAGGRIVFWNLEERKQVCTVTDAHEGNVGCIQFLHSQNLLLTSAADNALKVRGILVMSFVFLFIS